MDAAGHAEAYRDVLADMLKAKREYRKLKAVAEYHKAKAGITGSDDDQPSRPSRQTTEIGSDRFRDSRQIDAAETVLREAGKPMKTAEIADAMLRGGFPSDSNKKLRNAIFTGMTRKPGVFHKLESGTWALHYMNGHSED